MMTRAQRRKINKANAQASTGPKDTSKTRFNALKHGLRAEVIALPGEDADVIQARSDSWNDYYRPQDPAEQHLVNQCVRATLLSDRVDRFHAAELTRQVREAPYLCIDRRVDDREHYRAMLQDDPAAAVRGLERSGFGCQFLIDSWEMLDAALVERGYWCEPERDRAIRLIGHDPDPKTFKTCPEAWLTRLQSLLCRANPSPRVLEWMFDSDHLPDLYRSKYAIDFLPDRDDCLKSLRAMIAEQLEKLRLFEEDYRLTLDEPDHAEADERALILRDEPMARLFLRYHAESRTSFHRAYAALVKAIECRDEEETTGLPADLVSEAVATPIEADPMPTVAEPISPDEANGAVEEVSRECEKSTSGESRGRDRAPKSRPRRLDPKDDVAMLVCDLYNQEVADGRGSDLVPIQIIGTRS